MASLFCNYCGKETKFLPIHTIQQVAGVSRSTVYYWMDRAWIHWRELPSGRRIICKESISREARLTDSDSANAAKNSSKTVRKRPVALNPVG